MHVCGKCHISLSDTDRERINNPVQSTVTDLEEGEVVEAVVPDTTVEDSEDEEEEPEPVKVEPVKKKRVVRKKKDVEE